MRLLVSNCGPSFAAVNGLVSLSEVDFCLKARRSKQDVGTKRAHSDGQIRYSTREICVMHRSESQNSDTD
jgi:hypothetical protein